MRDADKLAVSVRLAVLDAESWNVLEFDCVTSDDAVDVWELVVVLDMLPEMSRDVVIVREKVPPVRSRERVGLHDCDGVDDSVFDFFALCFVALRDAEVSAVAEVVDVCDLLGEFVDDRDGTVCDGNETVRVAVFVRSTLSVSENVGVSVIVAVAVRE